MKNKDKYFSLILAIDLLILSITVLQVTVKAEVSNIDVPKSMEVITENQTESSYAFYDVPLTEGEQIYIQSVCERFNVPYELVLGIMHTESRFDREAVNGESIGIMQVHTINQVQYQKEFDNLGVWDLGNFYQNITAGVFILSQIETDSVEKQLLIYNNGLTGANELFKQGIYSNSYSDSVIEFMKCL